MKHSIHLKKYENKSAKKKNQLAMVENSILELEKDIKALKDREKENLVNQYLYQDARRLFMENQDLES